MIYLTIFHPFIILASSWGYSDMSCMEVDSVIAIPKDLVMMELRYMRKYSKLIVWNILPSWQVPEGTQTCRACRWTAWSPSPRTWWWWSWATWGSTTLSWFAKCNIIIMIYQEDFQKMLPWPNLNIKWSIFLEIRQAFTFWLLLKWRSINRYFLQVVKFK